MTTRTQTQILDDPDLLTPEEAAKRLSLKNPNTLAVWRCKKRYKLRYVRVGRNIRYRLRDIETFLEKNTVED